MADILIIEDDIALSEGISIALNNDGYTFIQSFDINSARSEIKENKLDLILLDINLPDGNGLTLLKEIRDKISTPIIILTANDMETDIVTGLELGADDFIFNFETMEFSKHKKSIELSKTEQKLLKTLIDNKGTTLSKINLTMVNKC